VTGDFLQEVSQKTIEKLFSGRSRVTAAASTSSKVKGLTLATREQYLSKIIEVLHDNYKGCVEEEDQTMDKKDVQDCAVEMEYSVFTSQHDDDHVQERCRENGLFNFFCFAIIL
jgi:hypothetical protein